MASDAWRLRWTRLVLVGDLAKLGAIKTVLDKKGCPVITNTVLLFGYSNFSNDMSILLLCAVLL